MILTDAEREQLIDLFTQLDAAQTSPAMRRYFWSLRKDLINNRSPSQIERMEREHGLKAA